MSRGEFQPHVLKSASGARLNIGDKVVDFRGDECVIVGWTAPRTPESTGRVMLSYGGGPGHDYYPGVINAHLERAIIPEPTPFSHYMVRKPGTFASAAEEADFLTRR